MMLHLRSSAIKYISVVLIAPIAMLLLCWSRSLAQKTQGIPEELKASLDSRLQEFTRAQAEERWDEVAALLGRYRRTGGQEFYTHEHKQCLITQMRSAPMVAFTVEEVTFSSELYSLPPEREKWWYLHGQARFKTESGEASEQSSVVAYRDKQEWYFTPPSYDDRSEKSRLKPADFSVDHRDELRMLTAPDSPVELVDVHVFINKKFLSLRDLEFRLRNKTNKKIFGYSMYMGKAEDPASRMLRGAPLKIEPGETSAIQRTSYSAYLFYCDSRTKHLLEIDGVDFVGGSEWKSPRHFEHWGGGVKPGKRPVN